MDKSKNMTQQNDLYPIFLRLDNLRLLVVGAGEVGDEKLRFLLKSSPRAQVQIVAPWMGEDLKDLLDHFQWQGDHWQIYRLDYAKAYGIPFLVAEEVLAHAHTGTQTGTASAGAVPTQKSQADEKLGSVRYAPKAFEPEDVLGADIVIAATNIPAVNQAVHAAAKQYGKLVNVADTPSLCDFYLGSVVTRGPLKVAISTNGQSPTFAKRFRQWLEAELPHEETTELLQNLKIFRDQLKGDFQAKVLALNELTAGLLASDKEPKRTKE